MAGRGPIAALFAPLLPPGAVFESLAIEGDAPPLVGAELDAMANVAPRRLRTFAFGRACARAALARLSGDEKGAFFRNRTNETEPIAVGQGGQPMWQPGVIGSITHTDEHATAVVMTVNSIGLNSDAARSIGIDLESLAHAARTPDLLSMVATPAERARFTSTLDFDPRHLAALLFSAKESVYKSLYPIVGVFLDFQDVDLAIHGDTFTARAKGHDLDVRVRFAIDNDHVATLATV